MEKENANITKEELQKIQKAIWKAQEAVSATINEMHNPESNVDTILLQEIVSDYLKHAEGLIGRYI